MESGLTVKLHINLSQGVIDIEGDVDLVREIYADYREQLLSSSGRRVESVSVEEEPDGSLQSRHPRAKVKRKVTAKRRGGAEGAGSGVSADAPKLDRDLDTAKLAEFYGRFETRNHAEKILAFLIFLKEELDIDAPNTDQVFTCYTRAKERIPKAFAQAFRDAAGKSFGYIEYKSANEIRITTAGNNHLNFDMKRKDAE